MSKITGGITAVLLLAFIAMFSALTFFKPKQFFSDKENRELSNFPELSVQDLNDGSYSDKLGAYVTDHFAGRTRWISFKSKAESQLTESLVNGIYVDSAMLLDTEKISGSSLPEYANAVNRYASSYDGTIYITVVPTSSGVYSDVLPLYLQNEPENQKINAFYDMLDPDIRRIDAYNILKMMKDNYIYYRNDTKWTSYGAYCVYRTVIQKLGFIPTTYDKYTIEHVTDSFLGNLYSRTLYTRAKPDIVDIYEYPDGADVISCTAYDNDGNPAEISLYDRERLSSGYMYDMYLGSTVPVVKIETSVNNERKLLVVKDSFADCFVPFLIQHYSSITILSPQDMNGDISDHVNVSDYEQTLFLFGIDSIASESFAENICERKN